MTPGAGDPHGPASVPRAGPPAGQGRCGIVLLHGRGGSSADIAGLAPLLGAGDMSVAAPQAAGQSWWPVSFLAPMDQLEPWLTSALGAVWRAVRVLEEDGVARRDIAIAGFSQGACLALEFAARAGGPWRAVLGLSGGLVGTGDAGQVPLAELYGQRDKHFDYGDARLGEVPVYLGCHARDPHIPAARVERSADVLRGLGAQVTMRLHPGAGHGLTKADLSAARAALGPR